MANFRFPTAPVWSFRTKRFTVSLLVQRDRGYKYDGDDENNETQDKLDSGEFVAFNSIVRVELDGKTIGEDYLGGSVYDADRVAEFWTEHRSADPMNRNCSIMREKHGGNACICHYFPDLVRSAIDEARTFVRDMTVPPRIRESAR